jgi:hypothetical protein
MAKVLLVLAAIGVTIYAAIDCFRSDDAEIRGLPKPLWLLVIIAAPLVGGVMYLLLGRQPVPGAPDPRRQRLVAPDDDPDFLRSLDPPRTHDPRTHDPRTHDKSPETEDDHPDPPTVP